MSELTNDAASAFEPLGLCAASEDLLPWHYQTCAADSGRNDEITAFSAVPAIILEDNDEDRPFALMLAEDSLRRGQLSTRTKIAMADLGDGDDDALVEQAIGEMTSQERQRYARGKQLLAGSLDAASIPSLPSEDKEAIATYADIQGAIKSTGNIFEEARWEELIPAKEEAQSTFGGSAATETESFEAAQVKPTIKPEIWRAGRRLNAQINPDGTALHAIREGDNLWTISSDILMEQHQDSQSYRPSSQEILRLVRELTVMNADVAATMLPGQQIVIPKKEVVAARTASGEAVLVRSGDCGITEIHHPSGAHTEVGRYPDGGIATLKDAGGNLWIANGPGTWRIQSVDAQGQPVTREISGSVEVDEDGTVTLMNDTDQLRTTQYSDGLSIYEPLSEVEIRRP